MSEYIDWTLEVVLGIAKAYVTSKDGPGNLLTGDSLAERRIALTHQVAASHGVTFQMVQGKYTRAIGCDKVADFDYLLRVWLKHGSPALKDQLLRYCEDTSDSQKVEQCLTRPHPPGSGEVETAFDLLLEEVDRVVTIQTVQVSRDLEAGHLESARVLHSSFVELLAFKEKVQSLRGNWGLHS